MNMVKAPLPPLAKERVEIMARVTWLGDSSPHQPQTRVHWLGEYAFLFSRPLTIGSGPDCSLQLVTGQVRPHAAVIFESSNHKLLFVLPDRARTPYSLEEALKNYEPVVVDYEPFRIDQHLIQLEPRTVVSPLTHDTLPVDTHIDGYGSVRAGSLRATAPQDVTLLLAERSSGGTGHSRVYTFGKEGWKDRVIPDISPAEFLVLYCQRTPVSATLAKMRLEHFENPYRFHLWITHLEVDIWNQVPIDTKAQPEITYAYGDTHAQLRVKTPCAQDSGKGWSPSREPTVDERALHSQIVAMTLEFFRSAPTLSRRTEITHDGMPVLN